MTKIIVIALVLNQIKVERIKRRKRDEFLAIQSMSLYRTNGLVIRTRRYLLSSSTNLAYDVNRMNSQLYLSKFSISWVLR